MAGAHVEFTGDASGAAAAAAAAQAAIDAVHGKTVNVDINVRQHGGAGGIGDSARALNDHARASERAAAGARAHDRASSRAASSAREHASASDRASASTGRLGDGAGRAGGGMERAGRSADRAGGSVGGFGRESDRASRSSRGLGDTAGKLSDSMTDLGLTASGAGRGVARAMGGMRGISGVMSVGASAVQGFGLAAAYATTGSAVLTAGVGALGAVGVGALGGVGVAAGIAGGAMASFAVDAHKDSARFGADMKQLGQAAHLGAQAISEPMAEAVVGLGRSMVSAEGVVTPAGMGIISSLREGFGNAAGAINENGGSIVDAAGTAAAGFARLTGEAAPGVSAFLGQMPSLTQGAVSGMSQITSEFGRSAGAIEGSTPAINRMMGSLGGLGAQLVRTGAGSIVPFSENVGSMAQGLSAMTSDLGPAIKPSMQAVTDTVNAASGGIGSLAPDIASFAGTMSANAPQLESIVGSLGKGMLSFGSAAVDGLGMAAPAIAGMAESIQANQGGIASAVGGMVSGAAWLGGLAADVIGAGASVDSFVKDTLGISPGGGAPSAGTGGSFGTKAADATRGPGGISPISAAPKGGFDPGAKQIGDSPMAKGFNKLFGLKSAGPQATSGPGSMGTPADFFSPGGGFDRISAHPGGALGAALDAVKGTGGPISPGTAAADATVGRAAAGAPPLAAPSPMAAVMGAAAAPMQSPAGLGSAAPLSGLFTGAAQSAQQGASAIPAAMQSAMTQSRAAIGGANLGGAMRAPMQAMQGAVAASNVGGAVGGQMNQMTKTVQGSSNAAGAAGRSVGGAIGGGVAKGTNSSMTVVDTLMINRITQVKETSKNAMNARSPSRDFEEIGRYMPAGLDLGVAKGLRASRSSSDMAADIASRSNAAMSASSNRFSASRAQVDADRTMMQSLKIGVGGRGNRLAQSDPLIPERNELKGDAKRAAFGEMQPGATGTRMVFDKQVMSPQAKAGVTLGNLSMEELNKSIESPLSAKQQGAMEQMQSSMGLAGQARNWQMFGERTQQNILRNRPGAFAVAGAIEDKEAQQKAQQDRLGSKKTADIPEFTPGGSGAGGQSYLGRDRINAVRQAAGLGGAIAAGYGQGLAGNQNAAVAPMARLAAAQKKRYTDDWGISSPSTVAAGYSGDIMAGSAVGLTNNAGVAVGAMGSVFDQMSTIGNDSSLQMGYTWGRNVNTGVETALKTANYQAVGTSNLEEPIMAALGAAGRLGPAVGGASVAKTPSVAFGAGSIASAVAAAVASRPIVIDNQVSLDGQPFYQYVATVVAELLEQMKDAQT